jgi:hypothetical protein
MTECGNVGVFFIMATIVASQPSRKLECESTCMKYVSPCHSFAAR